jgi:hypothetical protein
MAVICRWSRNLATMAGGDNGGPTVGGESKTIVMPRIKNAEILAINEVMFLY